VHVSAFPGVCGLYIFTRFLSTFCISVDETLSSGTSTSFFGLETFLCVTFLRCALFCSFFVVFVFVLFFVLYVSFVGYCSFVAVIFFFFFFSFFFCWALPYIADALLFSSSSFLSFEIE